MVNFKKYTYALLLLEIIILIIAKIIDAQTDLTITFINIAILSGFFLALSIVCLFIYFKGKEKEDEGQSKYLLLSFTIKFLSELVLAFFWFFIGKKTGLDSLLLFFILYLAFTLLMMSAMLKTLKYKNL
jgi:hypothetical protein